jgi:hypothetical protein
MKAPAAETQKVTAARIEKARAPPVAALGRAWVAITHAVTVHRKSVEFRPGNCTSRGGIPFGAQGVLQPGSQWA